MGTRVKMLVGNFRNRVVEFPDEEAERYIKEGHGVPADGGTYTTREMTAEPAKKRRKRRKHRTKEQIAADEAAAQEASQEESGPDEAA